MLSLGHWVLISLDLCVMTAVRDARMLVVIVLCWRPSYWSFDLKLVQFHLVSSLPHHLSFPCWLGGGLDPPDLKLKYGVV